MAWPLTPLRTFLAGGLPYIDALTLNSLQTGINGIIGATYSLAAVVVDGTGGSVVVPVAGTVLVSRSVADANEPTTATTLLGQINKESIPAAVANVSGGFASPIRGYGIDSVTRAGVGDYTVTFKNQPTGGIASNASVLVTPTLAVAFTYYTVSLSVAGAKLVANVVFNGIGADIDFSIVAWML